ncbi:MAG: DUF4398 domain-containing protein [Termitinemataceae bacterium]|nr:MAG: DUF4398 domain-containing protein [Termitinemataceae bacterium]
MKRFFVSVLVLFGIFGLYAQDGSTVNEPSAPESEASYSLRYNDFFRESLRLKNLANLALNDGDFDQSTFYSEESIRYAKLSDDYINSRTLQQRAGNAIAEASARLQWATRESIEKYFPKEMAAATSSYDSAIDARKTSNWDDVLAYAQLVISALENVAAPPLGNKEPADMPVQPNQYKVRPWDLFGDCLWNIARRFYGDPWKFRILYEANKEKLPDRENPNLIEVGTIIDIPPLRSEDRSGLWDSGRPYYNDSKVN